MEITQICICGEEICMKKYPKDLFWIGFLTNVVRYFFLVIPGIVLIIFGIWHRLSFNIGLGLLSIVIVISFVEQIKIKNEIESSDNPNFEEFKNAILSDNWRKNVMDIVDRKIANDEDISEKDES